MIVQKEMWGLIPGCKTLKVSTLGRVKKKKRGKWKIVTPILQNNGYLYVSLRQKGVSRRKAIHQLVLLTFVGPIPKGTETRHFPDRTKTNNRLSNLSYATPKVNKGDRVLHGTLACGERAGGAKLTWDLIDKIRSFYNQYRHPTTGSKYGALAAIERRHGTSLSLSSQIVKQKIWKENQRSMGTIRVKHHLGVE